MAYNLTLVSPPLRATTRKLPLSLLSLAGYIDKYIPEAKTYLIDVKAKPYFKLTAQEFQNIKKRIIKEIIKTKPDMVGFTVFFSDVQDVLEIANQVKKQLPKTIIIAGGVHATYRPDELLYKNSPFSYVVIGEGERTLKELVQSHISNNNNLSLNHIKKIKGIAYLNKNKLAETGFRELISDLDEIPMIPYEKLNLNHYFKPELTHIYYFLLSSSSLMTTRGCPSRCTFCTGKDLWKRTCGSNSIRSFSVERVLNEIEVLIKTYKIDAIFFHDQSFTFDKERVRKICNEIIKRKLKFVWQCQTKAFMIDDSLVNLMKKAGCIQIAFGFESGSQEALNRMKKGITTEQIRKAVEICKNNNMRIFPCFMINTPGETLEDLRKTEKMIQKMDGPKTYYNFAITMRFPGAEIYEELGKQRFEMDEYKILTNPTDEFIRNDPRVKMAKHNIDLPTELNKLNQTYNPFKKRILMHFDPIYLKQLLRSKRKIEYFKESLQIVKFLIHKLLTGERAAN